MVEESMNKDLHNNFISLPANIVDNMDLVQFTDELLEKKEA